MSSPMLDDTEPDHPAWVKLKEMHAHGDFEKIERMVKFWEALETIGKAGDLVKRAVIWLGVIFAAWFAVNEFIIKTIRDAVK